MIAEHPCRQIFGSSAPDSSPPDHFDPGLDLHGSHVRLKGEPARGLYSFNSSEYFTTPINFNENGAKSRACAGRYWINTVLIALVTVLVNKTP